VAGRELDFHFPAEWELLLGKMSALSPGAKDRVVSHLLPSIED
jgi:hypothetical protein